MGAKNVTCIRMEKAIRNLNTSHAVFLPLQYAASALPVPCGGCCNVSVMAVSDCDIWLS